MYYVVRFNRKLFHMNIRCTSKVVEYIFAHLSVPGEVGEGPLQHTQEAVQVTHHEVSRFHR